ncbi:MAG: YceI family protein [Candidatus Eremiobacteraeota bacterium]|nr:YceI family protein [Candidatus Eremiobacteraeota bacterium]MCW5866152.1 YceI family protein [Candidatus Eremiobacteraeota bacterium]
MSLKALCLAALLAAPAMAELTTYQVDPVHSSVTFTIRHLVSEVEGRFRDFEGTVKYDPKNVPASSVNFTVKANSIFTDNEKRDGHLKGDDFFAVEKFPTLTFQSKTVKARGAGKLEVFGNLTIKGTSKAVQVPCTVAVGQGPKGEVIGVVGEFAINRKDYGIVYNQTLDKGGTALGDDVKIKIRVEGAKK